MRRHPHPEPRADRWPPSSTNRRVLRGAGLEVIRENWSGVRPPVPEQRRRVRGVASPAPRSVVSRRLGTCPPSRRGRARSQRSARLRVRFVREAPGSFRSRPHPEGRPGCWTSCDAPRPRDGYGPGRHARVGANFRGAGAGSLATHRPFPVAGLDGDGNRPPLLRTPGFSSPMDGDLVRPCHVGTGTGCACSLVQRASGSPPSRPAPHHGRWTHAPVRAHILVHLHRLWISAPGGHSPVLASSPIAAPSSVADRPFQVGRISRLSADRRLLAVVRVVASGGRDAVGAAPPPRRSGRLRSGGLPVPRRAAAPERRPHTQPRAGHAPRPRPRTPGSAVAASRRIRAGRIARRSARSGGTGHLTWAGVGGRRRQPGQIGGHSAAAGARSSQRPRGTRPTRPQQRVARAARVGA